MQTRKERFGMRDVDHLTYLGIHHLLLASPPPEVSHPKQLLHFCFSMPIRSKAICLIYNIIQEKLTFLQSKPFLLWEEDLQSSFITSQWINAFMSFYKALHCVQHWELTQKIALHLYLTPYRLVQIYTSHSLL